MAYQFNGTSQYLSTASAPASGSPMTIAAWARRTTSAAGAFIVIGAVGQTAGSHRNQLQLTEAPIGGNPTWAVTLFTVGTLLNDQAGFSASGTSLNTWHHCGGVFASVTSRYAYLDGVAGTQNTTNVGTQNTADYVNIGARTASSTVGGYFEGQLAEFGIWDVALNAHEMAALADGMTCDQIRPQNLTFYAPLVRNIQDIVQARSITNNNSATVFTHPRRYG